MQSAHGLLEMAGERRISPSPTSVGFVPGTVVCLAFLDGFGVTDLGALVLFSSLGPGVSFAEFWSGNLTKRSGHPLVFFHWHCTGREPCFSGAGGKSSQQSRFVGGEGKALNMKARCLKLIPG